VTAEIGSAEKGIQCHILRKGLIIENNLNMRAYRHHSERDKSPFIQNEGGYTTIPELQGLVGDLLRLGVTQLLGAAELRR
jgi:hypothetical protein